MNQQSHYSEAGITAFRSGGYSCMNVRKTCKYTQGPGRYSAPKRQRINNMVITEW